MRRELSFILVIALVLALAPASARGGTADDPEMQDVVGDANYLNSYNGWISDDSSTDPAQLAGADLVSAWYETEYAVVKRVDEDGSVRRVQYMPTGLLVRIETLEPSAPTFGPTLEYTIDAWLPSDGDCFLKFVMVTRGAASGVGDFEPPQGARLEATPGCTGGFRTHTNGLTLTIDGALSTLHYPFSELPSGLLDSGMDIGPRGNGAVLVRSIHPMLAGQRLAPVIDMGAIAERFRIGSDVPADLECASAPSHPDCSIG